MKNANCKLLHLQDQHVPQGKVWEPPCWRKKKKFQLNSSFVNYRHYFFLIFMICWFFCWFFYWFFTDFMISSWFFVDFFEFCCWLFRVIYPSIWDASRQTSSTLKASITGTHFLVKSPSIGVFKKRLDHSWKIKDKFQICK